MTLSSPELAKLNQIKNDRVSTIVIKLEGIRNLQHLSEVQIKAINSDATLAYLDDNTFNNKLLNVQDEYSLQGYMNTSNQSSTSLNFIAPKKD